MGCIKSKKVPSPPVSRQSSLRGRRALSRGGFSQTTLERYQPPMGGPTHPMSAMGGPAHPTSAMGGPRGSSNQVQIGIEGVEGQRRLESERTRGTNAQFQNEMQEAENCRHMMNIQFRGRGRSIVAGRSRAMRGGLAGRRGSQAYSRRKSTVTGFQEEEEEVEEEEEGGNRRGRGSLAGRRGSQTYPRRRSSVTGSGSGFEEEEEEDRNHRGRSSLPGRRGRRGSRTYSNRRSSVTGSGFEEEEEEKGNRRGRARGRPAGRRGSQTYEEEEEEEEEEDADSHNHLRVRQDSVRGRGSSRGRGSRKTSKKTSFAESGGEDGFEEEASEEEEEEDDDDEEATTSDEEPHSYILLKNLSMKLQRGDLLEQEDMNRYRTQHTHAQQQQRPGLVSIRPDMVAPLTEDKCNILEAINSSPERFSVYNTPGKLEWGLRLEINDVVKARLPLKSGSKRVYASAVLRWQGIVLGRHVFGVEIIDSEYFGQGNSDGTYDKGGLLEQRCFFCPENFGIFLTLAELDADVGEYRKTPVSSSSSTSECGTLEKWQVKAKNSPLSEIQHAASKSADLQSSTVLSEFQPTTREKVSFAQDLHQPMRERARSMRDRMGSVLPQYRDARNQSPRERAKSAMELHRSMSFEFQRSERERERAMSAMPLIQYQQPSFTLEPPSEELNEYHHRDRTKSVQPLLLDEPDLQPRKVRAKSTQEVRQRDSDLVRAAKQRSKSANVLGLMRGMGWSGSHSSSAEGMRGHINKLLGIAKLHGQVIDGKREIESRLEQEVYDKDEKLHKEKKKKALLKDEVREKEHTIADLQAKLEYEERERKTLQSRLKGQGERHAAELKHVKGKAEHYHRQLKDEELQRKRLSTLVNSAIGDLKTTSDRDQTWSQDQSRDLVLRRSFDNRGSDSSVKYRWKLSRESIHISSTVLGSGKWGYVAIGSYKSHQVAVKVVAREILSPDNEGRLKTDLSIMSKINHPNIVLLVGAVLTVDKEGPLIVTELMDTSLRIAYKNGLVENKNKLPILKDVSTALAYLHNYQPGPIIHRNLTSAKVLLEAARGSIKWRAKLSYFSMANLDYLPTTAALGTPEYSAPEVFKKSPMSLTAKIDVYSFGVLVCELVLGRPPPDKQNFTNYLREAERIAPFLFVIALDCTSFAHEDRPSMKDVQKRLDKLGKI